MASSTFDELMNQVKAGERLTTETLVGLAHSPDILELGMLADALKRQLHGAHVTFLRVAICAFDQSFADAVPPTAREVRISGAPSTLDVAIAATESAKAVAGERAVAGFSWLDIERLSQTGSVSFIAVLKRLHSAGLDALAEVPIDRLENPTEAVERLATAGYKRVRLTIESTLGAERIELMARAAELQDRFGCIQTMSPLPRTVNTLRPTTGYQDVKMVALARLALPNIPTVQVDWLRYGHKLAQVALTFGANDLDGVSPFDDSSEGTRRAPLAEVRRNIESAGFVPQERDGRFAVVA
jgi:aminodeoxyfutalosine synthase